MGPGCQRGMGWVGGASGCYGPSAAILLILCKLFAPHLGARHPQPRIGRGNSLNRYPRAKLVIAQTQGKCGKTPTGMNMRGHQGVSAGTGVPMGRSTQEDGQLLQAGFSG